MMDDRDLTTDEIVRIAEQLEQIGRQREALEFLRGAVNKHSTDSELFCQYGDLAVDLSSWSEAEEAYASAIRLAPESAGPYEALGVLYMERNDNGDLERAQKSLERSIEIRKTPHAYTLLGIIQDRLDRRLQARESYNEALALDQNYEEAYYNLAITYREQDPAQALILFEKALQVDPEYHAALRELGWTLRRLGRYGDAEHHIRRAIESDESDGWAHIYLGNILWGKRDIAGAEKSFLKALDVWTDDSVPCWCLAIFYEYTDQPREADFFYEKAFHLNPDDSQANLRFGLFLREVGELKKAKVHLERALELEPDNEHVRSILSELDEGSSVSPPRPS